MRLLLAVLLVIAITGCERRERPPQFRLYGPATGGDSTAWSNPPFNGNKTDWRLHERDRTQHANEYGDVDR
jgi:hypothetical protein